MKPRKPINCLGHFNGKCQGKNSPEPPRNYSASLWESPTTYCFHGFLIFGGVHDSQNNLFSSLETLGYSKQLKKQTQNNSNLIFRESHNVGEHFICLENGHDGDTQIPKIRLISFENLEHGINI